MFHRMISRDEQSYYKIRQCRPDREYGIEEYRNIGFFNKNRECEYLSYSETMATRFLLENFGEYVSNIYLSINIPQAKSDFFLIASLFYEGGVSADVCSTCTASIDFLIRDKNKIHLLKNSHGFQKKFLYAPAKSDLFKKYLENLILKFEYTQKNNIILDYEKFSSQKEFCNFVNISISKEDVDVNDIVIIDEDLYNSVIVNDMSEEILLDYRNNSRKKVSIRGFVDKSKHFSSSKYNSIIGKREGKILQKSSNFEIVGENKHPLITHRLNYLTSLPDIELYSIPDVNVSGHSCLWKKDIFLRLESYLSIVAEEEMEAGFWKSPSELPATTFLDEEVIVSFGAGYGCYGHYLVDEIPRLAFTKNILGAENFLNKKILIPMQTPDWGINLMKFFLGLNDEHFVKFDHRYSSVYVKLAIIPTYIHKNYDFHPFIKDFFGFYKNENPHSPPHRRVCLSRKSWEQNKINQRVFLQQDLFEQIAISRGFEIISPETLSLIEQINLLRETRCQVGEHGSAQHASIYNPHGATIGTINPLTEIQSNLGRIYNDFNIIAFAQDEYTDEKNNNFYSLSEQKIIDFFDAVERNDEKRKYSSDFSLIDSFDSAR